MGPGRTFRGLDALRQPSWLTAARVEAVARIAALAFAAVAVLMLVAARMLGAGPAMAYAVQGLAAALACAVLWLLLRRRPGGVAEGAAMVAATLFCSPFLLVYDLLITTPLLGWWLTRAAGVQAAPLLGLLLFWLVARRLGEEARRAMPESA